MSHERDAYEEGRIAALAAASWVIDGNTPQDHIARMVAWMDDGDPYADDYLPRTPNLSGEYADDPTPISLARDITGEDEPADDVIDCVADAFEQGVADYFHGECERIVRAAIED